jgi:hypothetical protein
LVEENIMSALTRFTFTIAILSGAVTAGLGSHHAWAARGPTWGPAPRSYAALPALSPVSCFRVARLHSVSSKHPEWLWFKNTTRKTVSVYWLDFKGHAVFYQTLASHTAWLERTFATHVWEVRTSRQNRCLMTFVVPRHAARAAIR